jgi:NAD(P)-dependent dehydrogenase (short-subunit alcohol dehydrogenase family)
MRERIAKLYPLRRIGRPEDVANAVVFLASDAASFITGQTLSVSGGYTMM